MSSNLELVKKGISDFEAIDIRSLDDKDRIKVKRDDIKKLREMKISLLKQIKR